MKRRPSPKLFFALLTCLACNAEPNAAQRRPSAQPQSVSVFDSGPAELGAGDRRIPVIRGRAIATGDAFGRPFFLTALGSKLWVADITGDPFFHVVRIASGEVEMSGGPRGEGPGRFTSVMDLSQRPGDTLGVWAYDPQRGRLTYLSQSRRFPVVPTVTAGAPQILPFALRWISPMRLVGVRGTDTTTALVLYDSTGRVLKTAPFEILGDARIPYRKRRNTSGGYRICAKPDGTEFAVAFILGGRIDRYRADLSRSGSFAVPFPSNGDFERDAQGKWQANVPREYYRDCAATNSHLYALFSGRLTSKFPQGEATQGAFLHVFTWDGKLERVIRLGRAANAMALTSGGTLYTTTLATDTIYQYQLPRN